MKIVASRPETEVLFRALDQFRETCLGELRSAFLAADDPSATDVWTVDSATAAEDGETADNDDRTITNVRQRLSRQYGPGFNFYADDVRPLWQPDHDATKPAADTSIEESVSDRDAWFIRGLGGDLVPSWLERGICAVGYADSFPFPIPKGASREDLRRQAEEAGVEVTAGGFSHNLSQIWRFVNQVEVGDYIVTVSGQDIYLGTVESESRDIMARTRRETVRSVEWLNTDRPIRRREISDSLRSKMKTLLTLFAHHRRHR